MGCDGGTIPRRDELVRVKKKPEQKDKDSERQFRWLHCALTQQRLQQPIVCCGLGRLYSKQNVIEYLLEKDKLDSTVSHIKSLKDIKDLNLTSNPNYKDDNKSEGLLDTRSAPFICKLIGIEMAGKFRFIALWSCGCVFSERALKAMKTNICTLCQKSFTNEDIIILNGNEEETAQMRIKMETRVAKRKLKKSKKVETATATTDNDEKSKEELTSVTKIEKINDTLTGTPSSSQIASVANSKEKKNKNEIILKRPNNTLSASEKMQDPDLKKLKKDYSVSNDPKASDVYKSLFTSHKSEQNQDRAHWVTYNPFYN